MDRYFRYEPTTPQENDDYFAGRADAYDAYYDHGVSLDRLEDRFEFFVDPRVSDATTAYCNGYVSQIRDIRDSESLPAILETTGDTR
ncbi:hypothetical protein [Streptomyces decoyicus]